MNLLQKYAQKLLGIQPTRTPQQIAEMERMTNKYYAALQYLGVGPIWNDDNLDNYIKLGYAHNPHVYSIVSAISQKVGALDVKLCVKTSNGEEEVIQNHPALDLIYKPNPEQSKFDFIEALSGYLSLTGNDFVYIMSPEDGPNKGVPVQLHVLPSQFTDVIGGTWGEPVSGYELSVWRGVQNQTFSTEEVIHIKNAQYLWGDGQERYGMSPVRAFWNSVQTANSGYEANKKGLDNMGPPGVLFEKPNATDYITHLTGEQQKNLEAKFRKMSGTKNSGAIAVTSGNLDYINFGLSAVDLAIMDTLKMTLLDFCNAYHVPSQLFNSEIGKTYTNLKEARQQMYTDAVLPQAEKIYKALGKAILPRYKDLRGQNVYFKVVTDNIPELQVDYKELATWLSVAWWLTPNEARQKMGFDIVDDSMMDEIYAPQGKVPLLLAGLTPEAIAQQVNGDSIPRDE